MTLKAYRSWIVDEALPAWLAAGFNSATGLFYEKLALDGRPDPTAALRIRTQFRQVYTLAHAAILGLADRRLCLAQAEAAATKLRGVAWNANGKPGWALTLTPAGSVDQPLADLYDHAFALLGLGWLAKATGNPVYLDWVDDTLAAIDTVMAAPYGGWAENDLHSLPRRQNPHMHLFEACIALFELTGEARFLARAGEIFGLFRSRFFDEGRGLLIEYFDIDWLELPDGQSDRFEPGHLAEWVWLLRRYARASGAAVDRYCARLLERAESLGTRDDGFLADEIDQLGRPRVDRRRLWTGTEYLKGLIVQFEATGDIQYRNRADAFAAKLLATYLADGPAGLFIDQYTLSGTPSADHVPASILYHLFAVLPEIDPDRGVIPVDTLSPLIRPSAPFSREGRRKSVPLIDTLPRGTPLLPLREKVWRSDG